MPTDTVIFRNLMLEFQGGSPEAARRLCRDYQTALLQAVRRRFQEQSPARSTSQDWVTDAWMSFVADPPCGARFVNREALVRYLAWSANRRAAAETRSDSCGHHSDSALDRRINYIYVTSEFEDDIVMSDETPLSAAKSADSRRQKHLQHRPTIQERIASLLRQGLTHREIAEALHTNEKTIRRLVRRIEPEVPGS